MGRLTVSGRTRAGVEPKVLSERLGHSTLAFTMQVYQRAYTDQHRRAALSLEGLLGSRGERPVA
ncbi:hypothetical protein Mterra_01748 [Calidithermus terrae]|uniref:Tyr recombinase domain-containing protein n=1 Tax=Calidithermus terrae TaxID=1408545 RepID=A0A399EQE3_9DEIN|nr:hypothetical protein [Calidithermus terrae]RIH85259.1 hypothetical protein Mterra_01748 [Calidithermus terrae]